MDSNTARFAFALEYVTDVAATKQFFVDVLGLQVERDHPTFVQFLAGDGARYAIASDERMDPSLSGAPEMWWVVEDVNAAYRTMSERSEVAMPLRQMPFGTCFGLADPSGQVHYVLEFAQVRPSQAVA